MLKWTAYGPGGHLALALMLLDLSQSDFKSHLHIDLFGLLAKTNRKNSSSLLNEVEIQAHLNQTSEGKS